jgi:hypothetical protein
LAWPETRIGIFWLKALMKCHPSRNVGNFSVHYV